MTILRPHKNKTVLDRILAALLCALITSAISLVFFYNRFVNASHGIAEYDQAVKRVETENAELKDKVFTLFDAVALRSLAAERGLVEDRAPRYFQNSSWALASEQ